MPYGNYAQMEQFTPQQYQGQRLQEQQLQQLMAQRQAQQQAQMAQAQQAAQAQQQQQAAQSQQAQQSAMQTFGGRFEEAMNNPMIAAAMGAGSSLLASADRGETTGGAIRSGLFGAAGGYTGAKQRTKRQQRDEEERRRLLQAITGGFGEVADDGRLPQLSVYQAMMGGLGS